MRLMILGLVMAAALADAAAAHAQDGDAPARWAVRLSGGGAVRSRAERGLAATLVTAGYGDTREGLCIPLFPICAPSDRHPDTGWGITGSLSVERTVRRFLGVRVVVVRHTFGDAVGYDLESNWHVTHAPLSYALSAQAVVRKGVGPWIAAGPALALVSLKSHGHCGAPCDDRKTGATRTARQTARGLVASAGVPVLRFAGGALELGVDYQLMPAVTFAGFRPHPSAPEVPGGKLDPTVLSVGLAFVARF